MKALGRLFDVSVGNVPTDVVAGAVTGKYVSLKHAQGATFILCHNGASTDIIDLDIQQATDSAGAGATDLDVVTEWYKKSATTLAGTETWTKVTQSAASEITDMGDASKQLLAVVEIEAGSLSDGFAYVSANIPDAGSNATMFACGIWVVHGLYVMRSPANLAAPLS